MSVKAQIEEKLQRAFQPDRLTVVDESHLPADLAVTARTDDGIVMAVAHRSKPIFGVQFHPESVLTPEGPHLLANFLRLAGEGEASRLDAVSGSFATRGMAEQPSPDTTDAGDAAATPAGAGR